MLQKASISVSTRDKIPFDHILNFRCCPPTFRSVSFGKNIKTDLFWVFRRFLWILNHLFWHLAHQFTSMLNKHRTKSQIYHRVVSNCGDKFFERFLLEQSAFFNSLRQFPVSVLSICKQVRENSLDCPCMAKYTKEYSITFWLVKENFSFVFIAEEPETRP